MTMTDRETLARAIDTGMRQWATENNVVVTSKMRQEMSDTILSALRASTEGGEELNPAAYRIEFTTHTGFVDTHFQAHPLTDADKAAGFRKTPLYEAAALSSAPSIRDQVIEECARAVRFNRERSAQAFKNLASTDTDDFLMNLDHLEAAIRSLSTKPTEAEGWRDIASAPKDGTPILVFRRLDPWNVIGTAQWVDIAGVSGWIARGVSDPPGELGLAAPTHWAPIPSAPAKGE